MTTNVVLVVVATTKVRIFKQITTFISVIRQGYGCCCYHKGTYFQANHNLTDEFEIAKDVVVATTKVRIFKQITTTSNKPVSTTPLLLLPQRYVFSSKSQRHFCKKVFLIVVVATTKVRIFKQITTLVRYS